MLITSSRSPSANTRILCKYLGSFFNSDYITRGKMGLEELFHQAGGDPVMVVGQYHGNPGSFVVYDQDGECLLSVRMSLVHPGSFKYSPLKKIEPNIVGEGKLADLIVQHLSVHRTTDDCDQVCLKVNDEKIDFRYFDDLLFSFVVKSYR